MRKTTKTLAAIFAAVALATTMATSAASTEAGSKQVVLKDRGWCC